MKLLLERFRHAPIVRNQHLCLNIVKNQLQEPRTVKQRDRRLYFAKEVKAELLNPIVVHQVRIGGQESSENLSNFLSSELAKRLVYTFQELRLFRYRIPLQNLDFHCSHDFIYGWCYRCHNLLLKAFYRELKRNQLCVKSGSVKQHSGRSQHAVFDIAGHHCDGI